MDCNVLTIGPLDAILLELKALISEYHYIGGYLLSIALLMPAIPVGTIFKISWLIAVYVAYMLISTILLSHTAIQAITSKIKKFETGKYI